MKLSELLALVATLMLIAGAWLRWRLAWLCSDAEEEAKDKKITEAEARRRIQRLNYACPALTFGGLGLLVVALLLLAWH
jgi:hypothetical protein